MKFYFPEDANYEGPKPKLGRNLMLVGMLLVVLGAIGAVLLSYLANTQEGVWRLGFLTQNPVMLIVVLTGFVSAILGSMLFIGWGFWKPIKKKRSAKK
jgi:hypothetical protein